MFTPDTRPETKSLTMRRSDPKRMTSLQKESIEDAKMASPNAEALIHLPDAPTSETGLVKAWQEAVSIRTWLPASPDRNPLFLEKRVYQGSSGRVYPLPVIDRIETESENRNWDAFHLENEFVRFMILPELGGRIHIGQDKLNGYDFFYRQNVIKPALVGLAGPWISGGVEFNWPQHHRPATFMPMDCTIERDADGSVTIWCSDHDPMTRMKGMHGLCLHPDKAYLELRVRLYNRTTDTQTFLWWANVAVRVHEQYQSFFPHDVRYVADHAKRAVTEFPMSQGVYYGVDYGKRVLQGVPQEELPNQFVPDGSYPPNDLRWYANIPVPTSYMIAASNDDFFGGYDHRNRAGFVHVANHYIAPGKKQWTWGNHEFGYAWDRSLTESDGPYVELMAGVYTDNQPDFSFLTPGETKIFSQYWYPIRAIGVPDYANLHGAVRLERGDDTVVVHLMVTAAFPQSTVEVRIYGQIAASWHGNLQPDTPLHHTFAASGNCDVEIVVTQAERMLLRYAPDQVVPMPKTDVATEPPLPSDVETNDELYLIGLHLEQYRHPTRNAETYWQEAIRRDAHDSRANAALGRWHLRRGEFGAAEVCLRTAIQRMTSRNPNPFDGEPHYNLGLTLSYQDRPEESYAAFYKSTWNAAWRSPAYHRLAEIDCRRGQWETALEHIERSLRCDADNLNGLNLKAAILRRLGRSAEARNVLAAVRALDPLDNLSRFLDSGYSPQDGQVKLDLIFDLARAGFLDEALTLTASPCAPATDGAATMLLYVRAHLLAKVDREEESSAAYREAANAVPDYLFPSRLEEMIVLQNAITKHSEDARAPYYLGNLLYDRRRHNEAIAFWERAAQLDPQFPTVQRNLGLAYYNVLQDSERALDAFAKARTLAPQDGRILFEFDQLKKKLGMPSEVRLEELEASHEIVMLRDDLSLELATLYSNTGRPEAALSLLTTRQFHPWEGGEGLVLAQYVRANILLGQSALRAGNTKDSLAFFTSAANPSRKLGEARHLLMNLNVVDYWLGVAYDGLGLTKQAQQHWKRAARTDGDFVQMKMQTVSEMTYWGARALKRLGRIGEAKARFEQILDYAERLNTQTASIDYFATSLPAMLIFEEDLQQRQAITARFLKAQAHFGLGQDDEGLALLREVLQQDHAYIGAIDLLREMSQ